MKIEHIAMYVTDLERVKDLFIKYFNATADAGYLNKTTGFRSYFLTFEDGARLEIMNQSDLVDNEKVLPRTGQVHIAFRVGSRASVDTLTEKLKGDGYQVVSGPRTTGDGYYESCIRGIEGNLIEMR